MFIQKYRIINNVPLKLVYSFARVLRQKIKKLNRQINKSMISVEHSEFDVT